MNRNSQILVLFFIMLAGTVTGSILCAYHPEWSIWTNPTFRQGVVFTQEFCCIAAPLFWLAVLAALGLSATGLPFVPAVLFLRGAASGAALEMLYQGISGESGKMLLLTMPFFYAASLVMLFGAREALRFSVQITELLCDAPRDDAVPVKLYIIRFLVLFFFMTILGVLQYVLLSRFT